MLDNPDIHELFNRNQGDFLQWKERLKKLILKYYAWLKTQGEVSTDIEEQLRSSLQVLNKDEVTIALVSEFSRGKSSLINAIFFADQGREFLPSAAGRTTMCTVEIHYDSRHPESSLRLLPIKTLLEKSSLTELKSTPKLWHQVPLDLEDRAQVQGALREVRKIRQVSLEEADQLGLVWEHEESADLDAEPTTEAHSQAPSQDQATLVEIPKWRHALLNFPHPLLKQGLRVIDTPGLNALGAEPELMLRILPSAQVILFVLGADTGVTQSDLRIWRQHIQAHQLRAGQKVLVVLNKTDSLWSELATSDEIRQSILQQQKDTARILGVAEDRVFPVSAHKALVARVTGNEELLAQSRLPELEQQLFQEVFADRWNFLAQTLSSSLEQMLAGHIQRFENRLGLLHKQRAELFQLSTKSNSMLDELSDTLLEDKKDYMQVVDRVRSCQQALQVKVQELRQIIDIKGINDLVTETRLQMEESWTTTGLKKAMFGLFGQLNADIQRIDTKVDEIRSLLLELYRWLAKQEDYRLTQPKSFSIIKYRVALDKLRQEAEAFRKSPQALLLGKSTLIERFLNALVQQARELFEEIAAEAGGNWVNMALEPILYQLRDQKDMLDRKSGDLHRIAASRDALTEHIRELYLDTTQTKVEVAQLQKLQAENAELLREVMEKGGEVGLQKAATTP